MLTGGCHCGAIRYEADGEPFNASICHCADCRRVAASPVVAWFTVATPDYRVIKGQPTVFASSARAERSFCPSCGTPLTFRAHASHDETDVTTCSLDQPDAVPPVVHTHRGERVGWWDDLGQLPAHDGSRPPS